MESWFISICPECKKLDGHTPWCDAHEELVLIEVVELVRNSMSESYYVWDDNLQTYIPSTPPATFIGPVKPQEAGFKVRTYDTWQPTTTPKQKRTFKSWIRERFGA